MAEEEKSWPKVTVVALCYNHALFVEQCLESVFEEDYPNLELIVVDNASTDGSVVVIEKLLQNKKEYHFIKNDVNLGSCKAFNQAFRLATGKYIIDLATDDYLVKGGIRAKVEVSESLPDSYALVYSNAILISESGKSLGSYFDFYPKPPPTDAVYPFLFTGNFICPPSVMFKTEYLKEVNGYDENLSFEDLDIWIRLGRNYKFRFVDQETIAWRQHENSLSKQKAKKGSQRHLESIIEIGKKALVLNQNQEEQKQLALFLSYYQRFALQTRNFSFVKSLGSQIRETGFFSFQNHVWNLLSDLKISIQFLYRIRNWFG